MKLHCIVEDAATATRAAEGGATVIQLRLKDVATVEVVERGRAVGAAARAAAVTFVVNDDVDAALTLGADGVHLGRDDDGKERARRAKLLLGVSASNVAEARDGVGQGAGYIGAGPVWATPSKTDADEPIGLGGLAAICEAVSVPVVAIGGIDASNAAECIAAGARGVAVIRAVSEAHAVRAAVDAATR
jgi:thiamine-phosphate pyrophosphorylase